MKWWDKVSSLSEIAKDYLNREFGYGCEDENVYYLVILKESIYFEIEYDPYMDTHTVREIGKYLNKNTDDEE